MSPGSYDLDLYRGDTYTWRFQLWNDPDRTDPTDLTGATAAAEIRDKPGGTTIVALGCTITDPNIIDVELPAEDWVNSPLAAWDLEVTYPGGVVRTAVAGRVTVTADVTGSTPTVVRAVRSA